MSPSLFAAPQAAPSSFSVASAIDPRPPTLDLPVWLREAEASPRAFFQVNSRSFSFAARLFPPAQRRLVELVYAFCRCTDEMVDSPMSAGSPELAAAQLDTWEELVHGAYQGRPSGIAFLDEIMDRSARAGVPFELIAELIAGVRSDLGPVAMADWEALRRYCYQVASVIGIWMTRLFGVQDPWLLARAETLGYALQLTNILRDVGEDLAMDRVYLPQTLLERHGLRRADLEAMAAGGPILPAYRALMKEMVAVAESCYGLACAAVPHLPRFYARPVAAAAAIYRGILTGLRCNGYDNFRRRARTQAWQKPLLAAAGLWRVHRPPADDETVAGGLPQGFESREAIGA